MTPSHRTATAAALVLLLASGASPAADFSWVAGTWAANGLPNPLLAGDRVLATGAAAKTFTGQIVSQGQIVWQTTSNAHLSGSGTVLRNEGLFDLQTDAGIVFVNNLGERFDNTGLLRKSGGTGTSAVTAIFDNRSGALVEAQSGTIAFRTNGSFEPGSRFGGAGRIVFESGNHAFREGFTSTVAELRLAGATLRSVGDGPVVIGGDLAWSGGIVQGSWALPAGQTLSGLTGSFKQLRGSFANAGEVIWATAQNLELSGSGTVWRNAGLFDLQADAGIVFVNNLGERFDNTGLLRKSGGSGTSTITSRLSNTGILEVTSGTLALPSTFFNEGLMRGTTRYAATLLDNRGTLAPGLPDGDQRIAVLTIAGALRQSADATLAVDVGPLGFSDLLLVTGVAQFAGLLEVTALAGYAAEVGDRFRVATFASRSGSFAEVLGLGFADGTVLGAEFGAGWLDVVVLATAPVPEPATLALWLAGLLALARRRARG
jgi:hypothetical protein